MPISETPIADLEQEVGSLVDRDRAVLRIQEGLGFRYSFQTKAIILRLQEAQRELERGKTLPPFMLREGQTLNLAAGGSTVSLPDDFLRRSNQKPSYVSITTGKPRYLEWRNYQEAQDAYIKFNPQGPLVVSIYSGLIYFFPSADRGYTVTWSYYQKGEILETNISNLWLANAPELLIGLAGLKIANDTRNATAIKLFGDMYLMQKATWLSETVIQDEEEIGCLGGDN